jgi:hypothetical protein
MKPILPTSGNAAVERGLGWPIVNKIVIQLLARAEYYNNTSVVPIPIKATFPPGRAACVM